MELANGSNMHSAISEVFISSCQQSWFCMSINFWGQLGPESQTPFLPTVEWGQAQWAVLCFPWRQMRATTDTAGAGLGSLGQPRKDLGVLQGRSWSLHWGEGQEQGTGAWCFRETDPDFHLILPSSKKFSVSANLFLYRNIFFYITTLKLLILNILLQKKNVNTDDVFQDLIFPCI